MTQTLDLDAIEARHDLYATVNNHSGKFTHCEAADSADDVPALAAEIRRLRAELHIAQQENRRLFIDGEAKRGTADRLRAELEQAQQQTAAERQPVDVDTLARLIHDADVFVNNGDYPGWDDLSKTPGLGQDEVRKAARYLLRRLSITPHPAPAAVSGA